MTEQMKPSGINWVGDIPQQWNLTKIQFLFEQVKERNVGVKEKNLLSLSYGRIVTRDIEGAFGLIPENYDTYNIIKKGDIVLRLTDMQNDQVSLRTGIVKENRGIITSAYVTLRTRKANSAYYHWYLYAFDITKEIYAFGQGVRQNLTYEELKKMLIPVPDYTEQQAIADFLDEQCAKIDDIAADIEKQIGLLQKYKKSLISETVTKGLDKSAPMKDSGIEWIGKIPVHWNIIRITKYLESLVDYRGKTPEKVDDGIFLVTAKNIKNGLVDYSLSQEHVSADNYEEIMHRGKPAIGDVLFTTEAPLGEVANVDKVNIALAQRVIKFRGKKECVDNFYLKYWLMSLGFQSFLWSLATGSTALGIAASKLGQLKMPLPRIEEQCNIANFLDSQCSLIEEIVGTKQSQLDIIHQYKKSLIYEYVTGKKRVKETQ